ncbi:MAG: hypothetical protein GQ550_05030, partial [Gammaproteobacteria bacterium]|nr:hypothetical protein [Gammaproteobacteria bacterium]
SPDIPWHSNSKSPDRWKPENGYHYVEPPVKKQPYPDMSYNMPANYNYGYSAPVMNWPGVARSNSYAPVYTPNNRPQNGGYVRRRPAMNHSAMQSRQPAKRTSYPATGKP